MLDRRSPPGASSVRLNRRCAAKLLVAPAFLAGLRTLAWSAEPYPGKPIRIIVPYPAGGPYDGIPRIIAQWISAQRGWSIVIDNRSGATGIIGVMAAKQAPPDGHTLVVLTTSTHGSMPALKRNLAYDPVKDFAPIVLMADAALVLLVRDDLPVRSGTTGEFAAFVALDISRYKKLAEDMGLAEE